MRLSFGKHKGYYLEEVPDSYLWWLFGQDFLKPDVAKEVKSEVIARWPEKFEIKQIQRVSRTKTKLPQSEIKSIYRELALRYHPDTGGDTEAMKALNEFYERLQALK